MCRQKIVVVWRESEGVRGGGGGGGGKGGSKGWNSDLCEHKEARPLISNKEISTYTNTTASEIHTQVHITHSKLQYIRL